VWRAGSATAPGRLLSSRRIRVEFGVDAGGRPAAGPGRVVPVLIEVFDVLDEGDGFLGGDFGGCRRSGNCPAVAV
jgi:hypothetical protein